MRLASWREIARIVRESDVVLEVLDARDPANTRSRRVEDMASYMGKRLLVVLNKADLVPASVSRGWVERFRGEGVPALAVSARERLGTRRLRTWIKANAPKPFTVAVVGYPKTGKSSLINVLRGRKGAPTSPVPGSHGYTRGFQLLKVEPGFYMVDTPGVLPVEGPRLVAVIRGAPPESLRDPVSAAVELIESALSYNSKAVVEAYGIEERDPYRVLEELARRRGWFYKSTGEPLIEEAARAVIRDYHRARLTYYVPPW